MYKLAIEENRTEEVKSLHSLIIEKIQNADEEESRIQEIRIIEDQVHQHWSRDVLLQWENKKMLKLKESIL